MGGALIAGAGWALAASRSLGADGACIRNAGTIDNYSCGIPVGSDFPSDKLNGSEIDFFYYATSDDTIRAATCRESYFQPYVGACSPNQSVKVVLNTTTAVQLFPSTTSAAGGSVYDYRTISVWAGSKTTTHITPLGIYVYNTAGY
jgi:hypothetical protein